MYRFINVATIGRASHPKCGPLVVLDIVTLLTFVGEAKKLLFYYSLHSRVHIGEFSTTDNAGDVARMLL